MLTTQSSQYALTGACSLIKLNMITIIAITQGIIGIHDYPIRAITLELKCGSFILDQIVLWL